MTAAGVGALMSGASFSFAQSAAAPGAGAADPEARKAFLAGLDMIWQKVPRTFYEGPFLGNGGLGASLYYVANRLSFTLGHSRVRDHQPIPSSATFANSRLRIGRLDIVTAGVVTDVDLRLNVHDAVLSGTITTDKGSIAIKAFVDSTRDLLVVSTEPSGGETVDWAFNPYPARSPRLDFRIDDMPAEGIVDNPDPVIGDDRSVQKLTVGGSHTTLWRTEPGLLVATVAASYPDDTSEADAEKALAVTGSFDDLAKPHRDWWNTYYQNSFVSIPDGRLQAFYWLQLYKIASATRAGLPPIGTASQWLEPTPWTATWWNLNVQLEYWLINATAHWELDSLTEALDTQRDNLALNVPEKYRGDSYGIARTAQETLRTLELAEPGDPDASGPRLEIGNLTYALHNVWLRYRHTMDDALLRDVLFPILTRAVNYNLHFLTEGEDGKLHMPRTYSPEFAFADDCNYTLSLLYWGCQTLIWSAERLKVDDPLLPKWKDTLARLTPPPQNAEEGLMIGKDVPLDASHRHYSHIQWFYPLYVYDVTEPDKRDLLERSLAHWISFKGALQGYTFTGASSMSSMLGKGDDALGYMNDLLDGFIQPNTMYAETGPVIETPLSGAQSIHDMLISSWGDRIRLFPGVPAAWADVSFGTLRTEGAFEVSASRKGGKTEWVRITSLAGEPCRIDAANLPEGFAATLAVEGADPVETTTEGGVVTLALEKGQTAILSAASGGADLTIAPVAANEFSWGKPRTARGPSVPVDLTSVYNNDGISTQANQKDGNLGNDYSFPSEEIPAAGPLRLGEVDWTFPSHADGAMNNLVPKGGEKVEVTPGNYARINVIGCTILPPTQEFGDIPPPPTVITATFSDGSTQDVPIAVSDWSRQSTEGDDVASQVTRRHTLLDLETMEINPAALPPINRQARIYHQWADLDASKELASLSFGANEYAHIFALSVEKPVS